MYRDTLTHPLPHSSRRLLLHNDPACLSHVLASTYQLNPLRHIYPSSKRYIRFLASRTGSSSLAQSRNTLVRQPSCTCIPSHSLVLHASLKTLKTTHSSQFQRTDRRFAHTRLQRRNLRGWGCERDGGEGREDECEFHDE